MRALFVLSCQQLRCCAPMCYPGGDWICVEPALRVQVTCGDLWTVV